MKNLLIIGARGFGREVYSLAKESYGYNESFVVKGFLDDKFDALYGLGSYPPIINSVENYQILPDDVFICALGDVNYKKKYADIILGKGGKFINIIHNDAHVSEFAQMGYGCIMMGYSSLSNNVKIGNFVTMQGYSTLGHDTNVGSYCELETFTFTGGYAVVGDFVTLHTSAIISPHKRVGDHAIVGAGSVVIKNVKEGTTVYGNPAKKLEY